MEGKIASTREGRAVRVRWRWDGEGFFNQDARASGQLFETRTINSVSIVSMSRG